MDDSELLIAKLTIDRQVQNASAEVILEAVDSVLQNINYGFYSFSCGHYR